MRLKKFTGESEAIVMQQVKDELGKDALIVNITKKNPKGIYKFFKKAEVEITAVAEEQPKEKLQVIETDKNKKTLPVTLDKPYMVPQQKRIIQNDKILGIEKKLSKIEDMLSDQILERELRYSQFLESTAPEMSENLKVFYKHLAEHEVEPTTIEKILEDISSEDMNKVVAQIYKRMRTNIGEPQIIGASSEAHPKVVFLVGTTGVGKTTTIAKLATHYALDKKKKIGFITADTFRIAAVEQLKVYASILDVNVEVIYSAQEITEALEKLSDCDMVFVDTAGRSHKNVEQLEDLKELLQIVDEKEVYLVLSLTSKYKDLCDIIETYNKFTDSRLIFTKLDETEYLGNIINVAYKFDNKFSYCTFGQNVPDDFKVIDPSSLTKELLGGR